MNPSNPSDRVILLTVDVEDWFQVENLRPCCPVSSWPSQELRVEGNTHKLLDLFDSFDVQQATGNLRTKNSLQATFFVLGWLAERLPHLVREIHARGHEVASHGYGHELCNRCSADMLKEDLVKSKKLLEDISGAPVCGYRAPSFSINDDILKIIADAGYLYDSSYNSFGIHGRYGKISLNGRERSGIAYRVSEGFYELPISNLQFFPSLTLDTLGNLAEGPERSRRAHSRLFMLPWGGGAYFRLIPSALFMLGIRQILRKQKGYLFYMHPWEVDPDQPRLAGTKAFSRFKHYTNLGRTSGKLRSLLNEFHHCRFVSCHEYLRHN